MTKYPPENLLAPAALALQSSLDDCRRAPRRPHPSTVTCPIRETLDFLGSKWTVLIVIALSGQVRRFNELRREIPDISQRMLTQTLRDLERAGLVERTIHPTIPPRVDYRLSPLGISLLEPLARIVDWAARNGRTMHHAMLAFDAGARPPEFSAATPEPQDVPGRCPGRS